MVQHGQFVPVPRRSIALSCPAPAAASSAPPLFLLLDSREPELRLLHRATDARDRVTSRRRVPGIKRGSSLHLAPLRSAAGGQDATGRVWGEIRKIDTAYNAALLRARILDVDVNFHTLRHTFASHYVMRGGSLVKLQAILGHASIRTTQVYAHLAPDHLSGATAILEGLGAEINARSTHKPATAGVTASSVV